jgi:hypothetical protein
MKSLYKLFAVLFVFASINANAQIELLEFEVNAPSNISGVYVHGDGFGATTVPNGILTADVVWAYDDTNDSLCCANVSMDLTGKIAMIRRGACEFGTKALSAENAGAVACIIVNNAAGAGAMGMGAGAVGAQVTIPLISLSFEDGAILASEIDMGNVVTASFQTPRLSSAFGIYHAKVPQEQIFEMEDFELIIFNREAITETNIIASLSITDPSNAVTVLYDTLGTLTSYSGDTSFFAGTYTPSLVGVYTLEYTVSSDSSYFNNVLITESFEITDYTFSNDNDDLVGGQTNGSWDVNLRYDIGSFFYTGPDTSIVTHTTFRLDNPQDMHGATFEVILYNATLPAGTATPQNYDGYTAIALGQIIIDSTMITSINDDILVELSSLQGLDDIDILPNLVYLISIQHNALSHANASALCPAYAFTSPTAYQFLNSAVYTDRFYNGGWASGINAYLRLHLDGYVIPTNSEEVKESINNAVINVFPNPTSEFVTVDLALDVLSEAVNITIIDVSGRVVANENFSNVQNDKLTFDVSNYAEGSYFVRIQTDNGFKTKQFIVVKSF